MTPALLLALLCLTETEALLNRPQPELLTGARCEQALDGNLLASWTNAELRVVLRQIGEQKHLACLLDRRINPNQTVTADFNRHTVRQGLEQLAETAGAELFQIGNTSYLTKSAPGGQLLTLLDRQEEQENRLFRTLTARERLELGRSHTLHWNDLDTPRDILRQIASSWSVTVENPELLPHDLWAGNTLPQARLREALLLLLTQFELSYSWTAPGKSIRLEPLPGELPLTRQFPLSRAESRAALQQFAARLPQAKARYEGGRLIVTGTAEELAQAARLVPEKRPVVAAPNNLPALSRRRFTLKIANVPASALMKKLEESGVKFEYDAARLQQSQIDLDAPISVDVTNATPEEFFWAVFDPLKLDFEIRELTVTLTPK